MTMILLGTIYGIGFGLSLVGGTLYLMVLTGLSCKKSPLKILLAVVGWPITWAYLGYQLYQVCQECQECQE